LIAELGWAREAAVDARVAGDSPCGYAQFLVASAERGRLARAASTSSVFMANTALARRIEMLTSSSLRNHSAPKRFALLGASRRSGSAWPLWHRCRAAPLRWKQVRIRWTALQAARLQRNRPALPGS
jgi:hypothetical protein